MGGTRNDSLAKRNHLGINSRDQTVEADSSDQQGERCDSRYPIAFGRYQLLRPLGTGGMGSVYLANDRSLRRQVAIKIPHRTLNEQTISRIQSEAIAAASVNHRSICAVHDVGIHEDVPFIALEYVDGKPLDQRVSAHLPMSIDSAVRIAIGIADGMIAAHRRGIVHQDLKPANILMRSDGTPVVTDFGLAVAMDPGKRQQKSRRIAGSPRYMAPEQIRADQKTIDQRTDVYGLGMILFELLTSRCPFEGNVNSVYVQVLTVPAKPPSSFVSSIDLNLDRICSKALAKMPEDRFANMTQFKRALAAYLNPRTVKTKPTKPKPSGRRRRSLTDLSGIKLAPPSRRSRAEAVYDLENHQVHQHKDGSWIGKRILSLSPLREKRHRIANRRVGIRLDLAIAIAVILVAAVIASLIAAALLSGVV